MKYIDAHIHIAEIPGWRPLSDVFSCGCAHDRDDFFTLEHLSNRFPGAAFRSFGVHPQNPDANLIPFLEELLAQKRIDAIGEAGFDLFTVEYAKTLEAQVFAWNAQADFSLRFDLPLIVHCRNALDRFFADSRRLKKISAVLFHSWPGSPQEGNALLKRGINAYFVIGKQVLNGNKRAGASAAALPPDRILAETDAPWQRLKNERESVPRDIYRVYEEIARLRDVSIEELACLIESNFLEIFPELKHSGGDFTGA